VMISRLRTPLSFSRVLTLMPSRNSEAISSDCTRNDPVRFQSGPNPRVGGDDDMSCQIPRTLNRNVEIPEASST